MLRLTTNGLGESGWVDAEEEDEDGWTFLLMWWSMLLQNPPDFSKKL